MSYSSRHTLALPEEMPFPPEGSIFTSEEKNRLAKSDIQQIGEQTKEYLIHPQNCPGLRRYRISLAGISKTSPEFQFVNPHATHPQILVCLRGVGQVWINGKWQACTPGMAYCTPGNRMNGYLGAWGCEFGWITYEPSVVWPLSEPTLIEIDPAPLETILSGLHHESEDGRAAPLLEHWVELLQAHGERVIAPSRGLRLSRLWQKVREDLSFPWTLASLAKAAGVGAEYLRRLCIQEVGLPPMRHVTGLRMQQAVALLGQGYRVDAVAELVGYENPFAFSIAFKRTIGRCPSDFCAKL